MNDTANSAQWTCSATAEQFLESCRRAVADPAAFETFRHDPYICHVIEARPAEWIGLFMAAAEASQAVTVEDALKAAAINESVGQPLTGQWRGVPISGTTASYLMTYASLVATFGPLDGMRIVEVGGGYGGLASIVLQLSRPAAYTIYDIPEVLGLARAYLNRVCRDNTVEFETSPQDGGVDLLVSCCALSELNEDGLAMYQGLLSRAARGCLMWSVTEQSLPWAKDSQQVLARLQAMVPDRVVAATECAAFCRAFSWWAPNSFLWGVAE